ncbi:MAG: dUTP diphosphatase [Planctomycetia bacterium]|nr:dUTP diphosphatase [Planctomycetia bacterium]
MLNQIAIAIQQLPGNQDLPLPAYQTEHAAAMDLPAAVTAPLLIQPGQLVLIPCGFSLAIPPGYEGQVRPRSGLAIKHGLTLANAPGTIDADYRGEVKVGLINLGREPVQIERGMRIAQLLIAPVMRVNWQVVDTLPVTERGAGGFGHTGK